MRVQRSDSMSEQIITYESAEAASIQTVTGWVSRKGLFCGNNEHAARYDGCTHRPCGKCGAIIPINSYCRDCGDKAHIERYFAMQRDDWNGTDALYSYSHDEWFSTYSDLVDFCRDGRCTPKDLHLIIGVPVYAHEIDPYDCYESDMPDEDELPSDIMDAFEVLNRAIRDSKSILTWKPGKFAATSVYVELEE